MVCGLRREVSGLDMKRIEVGAPVVIVFVFFAL